MSPGNPISPDALRGQLRALLPLLASVYGLALLALVVLVLVNLETGIPIAFLTRDPTAAVEAPFYAGIYSSFGVLLWSGATSVCLFSAFHLSRGHGSREWGSFLLSSGLLSGWLLLDDLFLLHETVLPHAVGIPQKVVVLGYGVITASYLLRYRNTILKTEFLLLGLAFACFGVSVVADFALASRDFKLDFIAEGLVGHHLLEDGAKLFGIVGWTAYFLRVSARAIRPVATTDRA